MWWVGGKLSVSMGFRLWDKFAALFFIHQFGLHFGLHFNASDLGGYDFGAEKLLMYFKFQVFL